MKAGWIPGTLALALAFGLVTPSAVVAGSCVEEGSVVVFVPQQEGWMIGAIGGTVVGVDCTYDLPVTKGWTIRLQPEGPIKLSIGTLGYGRLDPTQPFQAKADGTIRIVVKRTTERGADFTYKLVMDLRKPGL